MILSKLLLVICLAFPLAGVGVALSASVDDSVSRVERVLAELESSNAPTVNAVAQQLSALGPSALPALLASLSRETSTIARAPTGRAAAVLLAFQREDSARWRTTIDAALAAGPSQATIVASLLVVECAGRAPDIGRAVRCATLDAGLACRGAFQRCITQLLSRDETAFSTLDGALRAMPDDLAPIVVRAVADTHKLAGAQLLAHWITIRRDLRIDLVPRLGSMARALAKPLPEDVLAPVRELIEHGDAETLHESLIACARLEDYEAIPFCIRWLREGTNGVRTDALWALQNISRLKLSEDPIPWTQWFALESAWWAKDSDKAFRALDSGTRAEKIHTLSAISRLHAWRDKLASGIVVALGDRDAEIAVQAATLLGSLSASVAVPRLISALDRDEPSVSRAAWIALKAITKKSLAQDRHAWESDELAER